MIQPACGEALGIEPVRADRISEFGEITDRIFQHLRDDDLGIADVSDGNANVMYELGLRHTTGKLTVQIGERGRLPFDIIAIRTIFFNRTVTGLVEARERLTEAIRAGARGGGTPVAATRIWLGLGTGSSSVLEAGSPIDEQEVREAPDEKPGFLDMLAETEEAFPLFAPVSEDVTALFNELGSLTSAAQDEMTKSHARGGGAGGRLRVAQGLANDMDEPATRLEQSAADFTAQLARIDPGISYLIGRIEEEPDLLNDDEAQQFVKGVRELADAAEPALKQVGELADIVHGMGSVSNRLRPTTRRMSTALRRISGTSETIQGWNRPRCPRF